MTREELDITRWRGFSHTELYTLLQNGPGASASAEPAARWAALSAALNDIGHDLQQAINQARSSWAGKAADSAFAQMSEVASWAGPAAGEATAMQQAVEQQAEHIARVRAAMPAPGSTPQPNAAVPPAQQLLDLQADHEPIERATSDAARKAFEAMLTYQDDTTTTADALPTFSGPVVTSGYHSNRNHNLLSVLDVGPSSTDLSSAPVSTPVVDVPEQQPQRFSGHLPHELVDQSAFTGPVADFTPTRAPVAPPAPVEQGPMTGIDPLAPVAPTREQDSDNSRRPLSASRMPAASSGVLENTPMVPAAGGGSGVAPSSATPTTAVGGGGADRAIPRRMGGEQLMSGWNADAVEPVQTPRRRRDRQDEEQKKITESVDGAGSEVPPPVIGTGSYRQ